MNHEQFKNALTAAGNTNDGHVTHGSLKEQLKIIYEWTDEFLLVREDGRLERICEHGIGHTVGHMNTKQLSDDSMWVHGCDGCCRTYGRQE